MVEEICRLCFKKNTRAEHATIGIFSAKGLELNIAEILRKHFPDEVIPLALCLMKFLMSKPDIHIILLQVNEDDDILPKFVCTDCWCKSNEFHDFYNAVTEAQQIFLVNLVKTEEPEIIEINCVPYPDDAFNDPLLKTEPTGQGDQIDSVSLVDYGPDNLSTAIDTASAANNESVQLKSEPLIDQKSTLKGDFSSDNVQAAEAAPVLARENCEKDATSVLQDYRQLLLLRPFECDICQKRYKSKKDIRQHQITCHGYNKGRFECDICHKR